MKKGKNFYLYSIWVGINSKKTQPEIEKKLGFTKQRLKYYRDMLVAMGYIRKLPDYALWEIVKEYNEDEVNKYFKEVKKTTRIGTAQLDEVKIEKEIRGHAFMIKLELPKDYKNWNKRRELFDLINFDWKHHKVGREEVGEMTILDGIKTHFYNKTIVFNFDEKDFIAECSKKSKSYAVKKFLKLVKKLERIFNHSPMSHYGKYKFRVIRQHYAIMKNALAKQYIDENKKLECYTGRGLWLLIDDSFNLSELETVHKDTAVEDNEKVQEHFNNIKNEKIETVKEMSPGNIKDILTESGSQIKLLAKETKNILDMRNEDFEKIREFGVHLNRHIPAYEGMKDEVKKLSGSINLLITEIRQINK